MLGANNNWLPVSPNVPIIGNAITFPVPSNFVLQQGKETIQFWLDRDGRKLAQNIDYAAPTIVNSVVSFSLNIPPLSSEIFTLHFFGAQ